MRSRITAIMALLLVFSAGLVQPCLAVDHVEFQCPELDLTVRVSGNTTTSDEGPGETGETLGDPDGWLGGQNFRPTPPISSDMTQAPQGAGGFVATLYALLKFFLVV